jgi:hypothetical protein
VGIDFILQFLIEHRVLRAIGGIAGKMAELELPIAMNNLWLND